jgi:hypothetical protein
VPPFRKLEEEMWEEKLDMLKEYKNKNGDCNVPKDWPDRQLVNWVVAQRTKYRNGKLGYDRINRLGEIGFVWKIDK